MYPEKEEPTREQMQKHADRAIAAKQAEDAAIEAEKESVAAASIILDDSDKDHVGKLYNFLDEGAEPSVSDVKSAGSWPAADQREHPGLDNDEAGNICTGPHTNDELRLLIARSAHRLIMISRQVQLANELAALRPEILSELVEEQAQECLNVSIDLNAAYRFLMDAAQA